MKEPFNLKSFEDLGTTRFLQAGQHGTIVTKRGRVIAPFKGVRSTKQENTRQLDQSFSVTHTDVGKAKSFTNILADKSNLSARHADRFKLEYQFERLKHHIDRLTRRLKREALKGNDAKIEKLSSFIAQSRSRALEIVGELEILANSEPPKHRFPRAKAVKVKKVFVL